MGHILSFIISALIMLGEGLILNHMGYGILNWEYWMILILTTCYALVYIL